MKIKKRNKASRLRGRHTHARGFKKKGRGSGHRGGKGMAGTGKRADQRKTYVTNLYGNDYFGKHKGIRAKPRPESVSLNYLVDNLDKMAKEKSGSYEIDLKDKKIIGNIPLKIKLNVTAHSASKGAIVSIEKAGGSISLKSRNASED